WSDRFHDGDGARREKDLVYRRVDFALLPFLVVRVKSLLRLSPVTAGAYYGDERLGRLHAIGESISHDLARLCRDIESDFIDERDRSDRESEIDERLVDDVDGDSLIEEDPRLVDVGRQNAVDVEAGSVVHYDHGLAQLLCVSDRRRRDLGIRLLG